MGSTYSVSGSQSNLYVHRDKILEQTPSYKTAVKSEDITQTISRRDAKLKVELMPELFEGKK